MHGGGAGAKGRGRGAQGSGKGGRGGGAFEIRATGRIFLESGAQLLATGADGTAGTAGEAGQSGTLGQIGASGSAGGYDGGSTTAGSGGNGGNGSRGHHGGNGGNGGTGGTGGGGAGGTIKLTANYVWARNFFDLRGGTGGEDGERGRFIIDSVDGYLPVTGAGRAKVYFQSNRTLRENPYDVPQTLAGGDQVGSSLMLSGLKEGPDSYGILKHAESSNFDEALLGVAPESGALAMVVVMDEGPEPYNYSFPGYKWIFFVNLAGHDLAFPQFEIGSASQDDQKALTRSGRDYNPLGGASTPFNGRAVLDTLGSDEVFATLTPYDAVSASVLFEGNRIGNSITGQAVNEPLYLFATTFEEAFVHENGNLFITHSGGTAGVTVEETDDLITGNWITNNSLVITNGAFQFSTTNSHRYYRFSK